jgi:type VII secretion integral membrane protein EccD
MREDRATVKALASNGGDAMPDSLCRLSVQHGPHTVDLSLPRETPVGLLLPSIVDLVHQGGLAVDEGRQWHLSRVGHERLDAAATLRDNAIHDGELLLLTTAVSPAPQWVQGDPWNTVIDTADIGCAPTRNTAAAACLCTAVLGATALVWSGVASHAVGHVMTGSAIGVGTAVGAVPPRHAPPDPMLSVTLSITAVVFAAAAGFLAVPAGPSTANSLLAAAAACSMSTLMLRVNRCGAICLTALATSTSLTGAAFACGVAWTLPISTTGATLSALSLGILGMAARLSIAAAGLAPAMSDSDHHADADPASETPRAVAAHRTLTGLVIGSASAAALGAGLVASADLHDAGTWPKGAAFAAVVGLVMVLRARTHIGACRRMALVIGGAAAIAAGVALIVVLAPRQANWVCLVATAVGLSMLGRVFGATINPLARRAVDVLEYVAIAAVVPLACWVGGLYGLIRGVSLP